MENTSGLGPDGETLAGSSPVPGIYCNGGGIRDTRTMDWG